MSGFHNASHQQHVTPRSKRMNTWLFLVAHLHAQDHIDNELHNELHVAQLKNAEGHAIHITTHVSSQEGNWNMRGSAERAAWAIALWGRHKYQRAKAGDSTTCQNACCECRGLCREYQKLPTRPHSCVCMPTLWAHIRYAHQPESCPTIVDIRGPRPESCDRHATQCPAGKR